MSVIDDADAADADVVLLAVEGEAGGADLLELGEQVLAVDQRVPGRDLQALRQPLLHLVGRQLREQRLAVRGAERGEPGADLRDHHERALRRRVLGDEQDVHAVQHAQVDGLVELPGELLEVRPHHGGQVALGHGQTHDARPQVQAPGGGVRGDEVLVLEGAADAVDRGPRQTRARDQLAEGEAARGVGRQQPQDRGGPRQHLDAVALFSLLVAIGLDHVSSILMAPSPGPGATTSAFASAVRGPHRPRRSRGERTRVARRGHSARPRRVPLLVRPQTDSATAASGVGRLDLLIRRRRFDHEPAPDREQVDVPALRDEAPDALAAPSSP